MSPREQNADTTVGRLAESRLSIPALDHPAICRRRARIADLLVISQWLSSVISVGLFLRLVRVRATVVGMLGSALVLAAPWQVGTLVRPNSPKRAATSAASPPHAAAATVSGSFTGTSESTQYGNVHVKIVVAAGKITDVCLLSVLSAIDRAHI